MSDLDRIGICVCTFKRPGLLRNLLLALLHQQTDGLFEYSIVVVDNDHAQSAKPVVDEIAGRSAVRVAYHVEPEQNIALARNKAVANAPEDLVAFIDDDEIPEPTWLLRLREALLCYEAAGVLGPVKPIFESEPPRWMVRSCFVRPRHQTGFVLDWKHQGTGNLLIRRAVFDHLEVPFREQFGGGGEDVDFFRRAMEQGHVFVWCDEAVAHEVIASARTRLSFQVKRALLRGKASLAGPAGTSRGVLKSAVACAVYTAMLPVLPLFGRHVFVRYLIKDFDHLGKLLAAGGFNLIKERYVAVRSGDNVPASPTGA
jgi:succinoglycan biosynthesis protein ExoM